TPPPQLDKRALTVNMTVDVLSLNAAPKDASEPPTPEKLPKQDVAAYAKTILGRNFFFPANKPPRFASVSSQRGYPNKTLSFSVKASDPENGRLNYSLASGLEGAQIDERSGEIRWTPAKLGNDYEMVVRVTDDGVPALSTEERIRISVVDPPVPVVEDPFARDDPARDASITALVGPPDNLQVWVKVLRGLGDQPRTLHLNRGDQIAVGSFQGIVKEVRDREAVFELKDGRVVTVGSGQPLVPRSNKSG
ncbi:MAG: cadherin repeat domain-containing protein, partial [Pirellulaceae bacterium]